jgi:3-phosphoinositide dependent protein kinase-1
MLEENVALPASDLWALGCIIFQMHTGRVPFDGQSQLNIFDKILSKNIDWPMNMHPDTKDLIDKLL